MTKKVKKLKLVNTKLPVVTSLDNLEVGRVYRTIKEKSKLSILLPLEFNRGKKEGYSPERVAKIAKMIKDGEFMLEVIHVIINLSGKIIDGNNRKKALEDAGLPVNFIITAEPKFNLDDPSEILNNVSELNSITTAWFDNDAYHSALNCNEPTAIAIRNLKIEISKNYGGVINDMFTPSRIVVLAKKDKTGLSSKRQTRREYCSIETLKVLKSDKFKELIDFICKVLVFVQLDNPSLTPWFVIRQLMPSIWKYDLSLKVVFKNLKKKGFKKMEDSKMKSIKERVQIILKMGNV
ncbi:MAG: hypothetical protein M0R03_15500 [Novosphingobium sp.]|nr:hypothetical protein [Novosphingobium sp.]